MAAADESSDWSLLSFAKQVFGAKPAAPEVGFAFVEPAPVVEPAPAVEPAPVVELAPAAEPVPVVEPAPAEQPEESTATETEQVAAIETEPAAKTDNAVPAEDPIGADEADPVQADAEDSVKIDETQVMAVAEAQDEPSTEAIVPVTSTVGRQSRTASEMAAMVLKELRTNAGVPARGFVITVYGARPWNAMLTIKPEAGPIRDARLWRQRVQDIGVRLRRDFDLADEG